MDDDSPDPDRQPAAPAPCPFHESVHSQIDLERLWGTLVGRPGPGGRSLWLLFLTGSGRPRPGLTQIDEVPAEPEPEGVRGLVEVLDTVRRDLGPDASAAVLIARPGRRLQASDRAWARALAVEAGRIGLPLWPTHVATDDVVRVVAPDDQVSAQESIELRSP